MTGGVGDLSALTTFPPRILTSYPPPGYRGRVTPFKLLWSVSAVQPPSPV